MTDINHWYAVRCCCDPGTVLGFIKLSDCTPECTVMAEDGQRHQIKLAPLTERRRTMPQEETANAREMAIHSEHRPIEFWRTIRGFVEAS